LIQAGDGGQGQRTAREREHVAQLMHDLLALQLLVRVAEDLERGRRVRVLALVRVHLGRMAPRASAGSDITLSDAGVAEPVTFRNVVCWVFASLEHNGRPSMPVNDGGQAFDTGQQSLSMTVFQSAPAGWPYGTGA